MRATCPRPRRHGLGPDRGCRLRTGANKDAASPGPRQAELVGRQPNASVYAQRLSARRRNHWTLIRWLRRRRAGAGRTPIHS
ncbi:hypothetical protein ACRAWD_21790 [Caulobacter segnis]